MVDGLLEKAHKHKKVVITYCSASYTGEMADAIEKGIKEKGVVIEYYYSVTVKKHFNDEKDPIKNSEIINYYDSETAGMSDGSDA